MNYQVKATTNAEMSAREKTNYSLAREVATEGFVLLKNNGVLPLQDKYIALYGAGARKTVSCGGGSGDVNPRYTVNIEEGLEGAGYIVTTKAWLDQFDLFYSNSYENWRQSIEDRAKSFVNPMDVIGLVAENRFAFPTAIEVDIDLNDKAKTAIFVVTRQGGEGNDRLDKEGDFRLDKLEIDTLRRICEHYEKTLLVINVGGLIDLSPLDEIDVDGILFYGQGGIEGGNAFADVVSGKVCPSGKLTCTWAKKYSDYPCAYEYSSYGNPLEQYYREGVFVGYKYFDSFDVIPRYEFGFGLSYTSFDIAFGKMYKTKGAVRLQVKVKNIGKCAGKEVVQAYLTLPSNDNMTEYQRLVAFQKTSLLQPNEQEILTMEFALAATTCYDEKLWAFVLREGIYSIRVGNSSRNICFERQMCVDKNIVVEQCRNACSSKEKIARLSIQIDRNNKSEEQALTIDENDVIKNIHTYLQQSGCEGIDASLNAVIDTLSVDQLASLVVGAGHNEQNIVTAMGVSGNTTSKLYEEYAIPNIALSDGPAGLNVTPEVVVLPSGEVKALKMYDRYNFGLFGQIMKRKLGKAEDGIVHYQYATALPVGIVLAQTWNTAIVEQIGDIVATEMEEFGVSVWLAPGVNIYRNPLCGRTFEYYSEEPLVAGKIASALIKGVQKHMGLGVSIKHFACNNAEKNRDLSSSNVDERTLREVYLKPFRIAVEEAQPRTVMASYNKINGIYSTNNYDLLVNILRNEWGFDGLVMSDWNAADIGKGDVAQTMCAQCDLLMPGKEEWRQIIINAVADGKVEKGDLRRCAARVLKLVAENVALPFETKQ